MKSRLQGAPVDRPQLVLRWAAGVLRVLRSLPELERIVLVSPQDDLREWAEGQGVTFHAQHSEGLNPGLEEARAAYPAARSLVTLADLPDLRGEPLAAMLARPEPVVAACDWQEQGTNVLLAPPELPFCFGPNSLERHRQEARRRGLPFALHRSHETAWDLDTLEQLEEYLCR